MLRVLCASFRLPFDAARPIFYDDPFFDLSHKRVLRTPALGIVSCLTVIPARLRVGGAWVSVGGIAGVATHPAHQGQGYASRLIAATVPSLAEELGYSVSGLFALSDSLYRRFGWEPASEAHRFSFSPASLTSFTAPGIVRPAGAETDPGWAAVRALHAATAAGKSGECWRDDRRWQLIAAASGREWSVYQTPGQIISGYAVWERHARGLHLLELRAPTEEAQRGLLAYLGHQLSPEERLEWTAAPGELAALGLEKNGLEAVSEPGLMLRLIDLPVALTALHANHFAPVLARTGRSLTLRICDSWCSINNAPVRLTAAGVMPGLDSDAAWIQGSIAALAPIYFGFLTPSDAATQGRLRVSSPDALALADQLFPHRTPFVPPLDQF